MSWRVEFTNGVLAQGGPDWLEASDERLELLASRHLTQNGGALATPTGPVVPLPDERATWLVLLNVMGDAGYDDVTLARSEGLPDLSTIDTSLPPGAVG